MPETVVQDEVVSDRTAMAKPIGGGLSSRPMIHEDVDVRTGAVKVTKGGVEEDAMAEGARKGRVLKESTQKMLEKMEQEAAAALAAHEVGDADEDAPDDADTGAAAGDDAGTTDENDAVVPAEGVAAGSDGEPVVDEWQTKAATLEQRNREILNELEVARKTPKAQRTERETALLGAEQTYVEEGSIPALRKFLSVVVGAAPDSKEVDAELSGLFTDLTARELGVALDQNQQTLRDNARTRLLLARDKREKVEADKKPVAGNGAEDVQYGEAAKYVDNLLTTKGQSGTSLADEYPMLMTLAHDFDGFTPSEVLARAIRQEIMVGTLDPSRHSDADMIRTVAPKIEAHYDAVAKKIEAVRAKYKKTDTTKPSVQPKVAPGPSQEQRQSPAARTITNATASRAPAKLPKATVVKGEKTGEKTRKDFPSDAAWREHLLSKHFSS